MATSSTFGHMLNSKIGPKKLLSEDEPKPQPKQPKLKISSYAALLKGKKS